MNHLGSSHSEPRCWSALISAVGGGVGLLLLALLLAPLPALAQAKVLCVSPTGDYATIQAAVDAASDGDEIRVASGVYEENVVITRTLTISGRWLDDCSDINEDADASTAIVPEQGRAVTIDPNRAGVVVGVSAVSLRGDGTGLGGATKVAGGAAVTRTTADFAVPAVQATAALLPDDWRAQLASLAEQGAMPGMSSPAEVLARVDALFPTDASAPAAVAAAPDAPTRPEEVDCGGALYAKGVALTLREVGISASVASTMGDGYGGGACIIAPSGDGVTVQDSSFVKNTGSTAGVGIGGALFIQGGAAGSVTIDNSAFNFNYGSVLDTGWGGALALIDTPQPTLTGADSCQIAYNVASKGANGAGGGAFFLRANHARIDNCRFFANYASSGGAGQDQVVSASSGFGGGLYVEESAQIVIEENKFDFNVAQTSAPELNRRAEGGGAFVVNSQAATIANNIFDRNIAGFSGQGFGGGLFVMVGDAFPQVTDVSIHDNEFTRNWANVINFIGSGGGGLYVYRLANSIIATNTFTANVANLMGEARIQMPGAKFIMGGGMVVAAAQRIAVVANQFVDNASTLGGFALGGGLGLENSETINVARNTFQRNFADNANTGSGLGGAVAVEFGRIVTLQHNTFTENSGQLVTSAEEAMATSAIALIGDDLYQPERDIIALTDVVIDGNTILRSGQNLPVTAPPNNFAISVQGTDRFTVTNNVIAGSSFGGVVAIYKSYMDANDQLIETRGAMRNNTFYANGKYGLWLLNRWTGDAISLVNNAIVSHTYGIEGADLFGPAAAVVLDYTLFYANTENVGPEAGGAITYTHTVMGNPHFLASETYDFHLMPNSAAIDAGDPVGVPPAPPVDIEGAPRPYGARVDIGAYEWQGQGAFLPVILKP